MVLRAAAVFEAGGGALWPDKWRSFSSGWGCRRSPVMVAAGRAQWSTVTG